MFTFQDTPQGAALDTVISDLISVIHDTDISDKSYSAAVDHLVKLTKIKTDAGKLETDSSLEADKIRNETEKIALEAEKLRFEKEQKESWRPSPDAIIAVVGTLATAVLVLNFEKAGVITSKAFAFFGKAIK